MTALMQRALRRLSAVPESEQDRLAERVLSLPELAEPDAVTQAAAGEGGQTESLVSILSGYTGSARTKDEIDRSLRALRDEWDR